MKSSPENRRPAAGGVACVAVLAFAFASCSSPPGEPLGGPEPLEYDPHPETPTILRNVAMIDDDLEWTQPYVPGLRTTQDGRVGMRIQGGPSSFSFWLFTPEKLEASILPGGDGAQMLADTDPWNVEWPTAAAIENLERVGHHAICDPTLEFPQPGERTNPYACGEGMANDCYDLVIVSSTATTAYRTTMWGTPVTVEVSNPKTVDAQLARVELGETVEGATIDTALEWAEAAVTNDGRLLTGRWGGFGRTWVNPETGESFERMYDFGYSVLPPDAEPCDVTQWTEFHPMSHAPYDPDLIGRYGLAAHPFRDTEGNPIPDGEDMGGSYPWVDREGANVFMTGVPGTIAEQSEERYPRRCVIEGCEDYEEPTDWDRGFMVAGLWTHGKLVHLDGMINNMDWAVGLRPESHWWVELYKNADGSPHEVRFGAGRGNTGTHPPAFPGNENIMDSLQNLPNFVPAAHPVTPRDVVWVMSTGVATDEIAFDDYLDPRAVILSNMQATITQLRGRNGETLGIPRHNNGQTRELGRIGIPIASEIPYVLDNESDIDLHIQNGATTLAFPVPSYGLVEAGTGRVEPVALGGVKGRGFWLDGTNRIRYELTEAIESELYIGLYVDPRTTEGATRALFTFPDRTGVRLVDRQTLQYVSRKRVLHEVTLPTSESGWMHLGWRVSEDGMQLTLLVNGYPLERYDADRAFFQLEAGELVVGREREGDAGVRGWIDDFKVLAHAVDPEVACNHAGGTLITAGSGAWSARAASYPSWAHEEVAAAAGRSGGQYACYHDYSDDYAAHLGNIPDGSESLRHAITFPEGPLMAGAPRPDSSDNEFCLSCHTSEGQAALGLGALEYRPDVLLEDDPRRQPLQPPRRVFGNIPAGWIPPGHGPGSPMEPMVAPPEGLVIDGWLLPSR